MTFCLSFLFVLTDRYFRDYVAVFLFLLSFGVLTRFDLLLFPFSGFLDLFGFIMSFGSVS
jgi:hypothetical protein